MDVNPEFVSLLQRLKIILVKGTTEELRGLEMSDNDLPVWYRLFPAAWPDFLVPVYSS